MVNEVTVYIVDENGGEWMYYEQTDAIRCFQAERSIGTEEIVMYAVTVPISEAYLDVWGRPNEHTQNWVNRNCSAPEEAMTIIENWQ